MMNIKNTITTRFIATVRHLTGMVVALFGFTALPSPILAIGIRIKRATIPVWVAFSSHSFRLCDSHTFPRAKIASALSYLMCGCLVHLATDCTNHIDMNFRLTNTFGLTCGKFRTTLVRAKTRLAISPFFKFIFAPITNEDGSFRGISLNPAVFLATFFRTISAGWRRLIEFFSARFTRLSTVRVSVAQTKAFLTTKLGSVGIFSDELISALFTNHNTHAYIVQGYS